MNTTETSSVISPSATNGLLANLREAAQVWETACDPQHPERKTALTEARRRLRELVASACDAKGIPTAEFLRNSREWLRILVETASIGTKSAEKWWTQVEQKRLGKLLGRMAAFVAGNTRFPFESTAAAEKETASQLIDRLAKLMEVTIEKTDAKSPQRLSFQSDEARTAVLTGGTAKEGDFVVVTSDGLTLRMEVAMRGVLLFQGDWPLTVLDATGHEQPLQKDWSPVCWFSDHDGDYLELQNTIDTGVTVLRQIHLSRTGHWLLTSDVLRVAEGAAKVTTGWSLQTKWTFAPGLNSGWEQDGGAREAALLAKHRVRVLPLGLPFDRMFASRGKLSHTTQGLTLSSHGTSNDRTICLPLLLDWSPLRIDEPAEWVSLTVVEDGRISSADEARAYFWRIGVEQWMYYHSLVPPEAPRSMLGHHSAHETVVSRLNKKGQHAPIVQVDAT